MHMGLDIVSQLTSCIAGGGIQIPEYIHVQMNVSAVTACMHVQAKLACLWRSC